MPILLAVSLGVEAEAEDSQPSAETTTFSVGIVIREGTSRRIAIQRRRLKKPGGKDEGGEVERVRATARGLLMQVMLQFKHLQLELGGRQ